MHGIFDLSWQHLLIFVLIRGCFASMCVTLLLHRGYTHRMIEFSPGLDRFFRFCNWFLTAINIKEFMAVHRKHHTCADKEGDPHSPYLCGFWNIFFFGYRYYLREAKNPETLKSYGHGAPSDSIEKHFYGPYKRLGILILLLLDVSLFGLFGILTWIIQMIWIPFWAIGMVNAMGHMGPNHWFGYSVSTHNRVDHSLNIMPIFLYPLALLISVCTWGESLHSAHHDDVSNPNFARRWWEIDPGYFTLYVLWLFDLVKSRKPHQAVLPG